MSFSPLIGDLIDALRCLPGVGPKSAQRMALQLLERDRAGARRLAKLLEQAEQEVGHCQTCRTLTEKELCDICASSKRDHGLVCVVGTPMDVLAIEQSGAYRGVYHVLLGHLSPIDGVGPEDIGIDKLVHRVRDNDVSEVILATNSTVEGEATAFYVVEQLRDLNIPVSRIAHGVPLGGELEYVDGSTLMHALSGRKAFE